MFPFEVSLFLFCPYNTTSSAARILLIITPWLPLLSVFLLIITCSYLQRKYFLNSRKAFKCKTDDCLIWERNQCLFPEREGTCVMRWKCPHKLSFYQCTACCNIVNELHWVMEPTKYIYLSIVFQLWGTFTAPHVVLLSLLGLFDNLSLVTL